MEEAVQPCARLQDGTNECCRHHYAEVTNEAFLLIQSCGIAEES